jgi:uncharacterized protein (TIGR00730 family)
MTTGESVVVAVVGSARVSRDAPEWQEAYEVGALLAASGWGIMTGGYSGLMGAAAEGARSRGGSARGLPMTAWAQLTPDPAHDDLAWCATYGERLDHIARADVLVALPGGVGTLSEWAVAWASAQTELRPHGVVLVGRRWAQLVEQLRRILIAGDDDFALLTAAEGPQEVPARVREVLAAAPSATAPRG